MGKEMTDEELEEMFRQQDELYKMMEIYIYKYQMSKAEYDALDKALTKSGLYDDGQFIYQKDGGDYYACYDQEYVKDYDYEVEEYDDDEVFYIVPLLDYMLELDDAFADLEEVYGFTEKDMEAYMGLLKKAEAYKKAKNYYKDKDDYKDKEDDMER